MNEPNLNVIILANRQLTGESEISIEYPAYLSQQNGISVLEKLIHSCGQLQNPNVIFAALQKDVARFNLKQVLKRLDPDIKVSITPNLTMGSACTALLTACSEKQDAELLILSANEVVDIDLSEVIEYFRSMSFDAGTVVFKSIHPMYSYVKLESERKIIEFAQREQISQFATTGLFWFRETQEFVDSLKSLLRNRTPISGNYFVGLALNETILKGKTVGSFQLDEGRYFPLKNDAQVRKYELGAGSGNL